MQFETVVEQTADSGRFVKTDTQDLGDFEKYFHLRTNLRCMIAPVKIWIHSSSPTEASYGMAFELIKVLVKLPLEKTLKQNSEEHELDFLMSDSD